MKSIITMDGRILEIRHDGILSTSEILAIGDKYKGKLMNVMFNGNNVYRGDNEIKEVEYQFKAIEVSSGYGWGV